MMTVTIQGLDSFGKITVAAAEAAQRGGILVWGRYLYNLDRTEFDIAHAHGIGILPIGEHDTRTHHPIHDGYAVGFAHGQADRTVAIALGIPQNAGISLMATADDKVFDGADTIVMGQYCDGYRDGIGAPYQNGLYGGAGPVRWARLNGHVNGGTWVAGASYWDNGVDPADALAQMHQLATPAVSYGGVACDLNVVYDLARLGAWLPAGAPIPTPIPTPTPDPEDPPVSGTIYIFDPNADPTKNRRAPGENWIVDVNAETARNITPDERETLETGPQPWPTAIIPFGGAVHRVIDEYSPLP